MNISCDIIKDLLPLYHDEVCSKDSKMMIEEHLKNCTNCQNYLNSISNEVFHKSSEANVEQVKVNSLRSLKKKLLKKNFIISAVSIVCVVAIFLGCYSLVFHYETPIEYNEELIDIKLAVDEVIDMFFLGNDYYCSYAFTRTIQNDGIEQDLAFVYYTDTIWTKYLSKPRKPNDYQFTISKNIMIDYGKNGEPIDSAEEIVAVYYLIGDYKTLVSMSDEEFKNVMKDAILMWEKNE